MRHQRGFTLVEIMVAVGMMGGLALAGMQLFKGQTSAQRNVEANYEVATIVQQIRTLLTVPANCALSLGGFRPDGTGPSITTLKKDDTTGGSVSVFTVNDTQPGGIKIVKYSLSRKASDPADETLLTIEFSKGQGAIRNQAIKMMKIIFTQDATGSIISCYAYNTTQDTYWLPVDNDPTNIYFLGRVGMGTPNPITSVDIQSPDVNGNVATTMQIGTAGSQSAQQATINLETLGGNIDPATPMAAAAHRGWQIYARGNAYVPAGEQNDLGISYWNGSSWRSSVVIDSATGNVGMGTTSPNFMLDVNGASRVTLPAATDAFNVVSASTSTILNLDNSNTSTSYARFQRSGTSLWSIGNNGASGNDFQISASGGFGTNDYVTIERADGTLQFGPSGLGNTSAGPYFYFSDSGANSDPIGFRRVNAATNKSDLKIIIGDEPGGARTSDEDRLLIGSTAMTPAMNVSSYGFVGVNTGNSSPYARLTVGSSGTSKVDGIAVVNGGAWLNIYNPSSTSAGIDVTTGGSATAPGSSGANLILNLSGGNVGIGVATPDRDLTVFGTGKFYTTALTSLPGTWGGGVWTRDFYGEGALALGTNGNANVAFTSAGTGSVSGTMRASSFLYNSDRTLKKDIIPISDSLKKVRSLRGVNFTWKDTHEEDVGFIAQEVEKVEPHLVTTDEKGIKAVKYGNIVAIVIEAIKELVLGSDEMREQIKVLREENILLKERISSQEKRLSILETSLTQKVGHDKK